MPQARRCWEWARLQQISSAKELPLPWRVATQGLAKVGACKRGGCKSVWPKPRASRAIGTCLWMPVARRNTCALSKPPALPLVHCAGLDKRGSKLPYCYTADVQVEGLPWSHRTQCAFVPSVCSVLARHCPALFPCPAPRLRGPFRSSERWVMVCAGRVVCGHNKGGCCGGAVWGEFRQHAGTAAAHSTRQASSTSGSITSMTERAPVTHSSSKLHGCWSAQRTAPCAAAAGASRQQCLAAYLFKQRRGSYARVRRRPGDLEQISSTAAAGAGPAT